MVSQAALDDPTSVKSCSGDSSVPIGKESRLIFISILSLHHLMLIDKVKSQHRSYQHSTVSSRFVIGSSRNFLTRKTFINIIGTQGLVVVA